jgi:hypothetical protein
MTAWSNTSSDGLGCGTRLATDLNHTQTWTERQRVDDLPQSRGQRRHDADPNPSFVALLRPESRRSRAHRQVVRGERFFQDPERSRSKAVKAEQFGLASVRDVRQLGDTDRSEGPRRWRSDLGKVIVRHVLMFACRPPLARWNRADPAVAGMVTASRYANIAGVIRRLAPDEIALLKELRLSALADAPSAFASTYEQAAAVADDDWRSSYDRRATRPSCGRTNAALRGWPSGHETTL